MGLNHGKLSSLGTDILFETYHWQQQQFLAIDLLLECPILEERS